MDTDGPTEPRGRLFGRRDVLRAAGVAGVAGAAAAALTVDSAESARVEPVTAVSVRGYGAKGDGTTDDREAVQKALDAVGEEGGAVFFAPGDYLLSGPVSPRSNTLVIGSHTPRWRGGQNPKSACKLRAARDFSGGEGLVTAEGDTWGVTLRNLALVGDGAGANLHGLRLPNLEDFTGNESWILDGVTVAGFSGSGIYGTAQTTTVVSSMVHDNSGWGLDVTGGNRWNDCHLANCFFFFNRAGNVRFAGPQTSGLVEFANCRFERAGTNPEDLFDPLNPSAPGVRLSNARYMSFVNCTTDANCGNGIEVVSGSDSPDFLPAFIGLANCHLSRDGTGDNRQRGEFAGLKVMGSGPDAARQPREVQCANCFVTYGKADDTGAGDVTGPKYGVWHELTQGFGWIGGSVSVMPPGTEFRADASGAGTRFDPPNGLFNLPLREPRPGYGTGDGSAYLDVEAGRLFVRAGGRWRSVKLE